MRVGDVQDLETILNSNVDIISRNIQTSGLPKDVVKSYA